MQLWLLTSLVPSYPAFHSLSQTIIKQLQGSRAKLQSHLCRWWCRSELRSWCSGGYYMTVLLSSSLKTDRFSSFSMFLAVRSATQLDCLHRLRRKGRSSGPVKSSQRQGGSLHTISDHRGCSNRCLRCCHHRTSPLAMHRARRS